MSDPTLSEIGFKNKMTWVWTTLNSYWKSLKLFPKIWWPLNVFLENISSIFKNFWLRVPWERVSGIFSRKLLIMRNHFYEFLVCHIASLPEPFFPKLFLRFFEKFFHHQISGKKIQKKLSHRTRNKFSEILKNALGNVSRKNSMYRGVPD